MFRVSRDVGCVVSDVPKACVTFVFNGKQPMKNSHCIPGLLTDGA